MEREILAETNGALVVALGTDAGYPRTVSRTISIRLTERMLSSMRNIIIVVTTTTIHAALLVRKPAPARPIVALIDDDVLGRVRGEVSGSQLDDKGAADGPLVAYLAVRGVAGDPGNVSVGLLVPDVNF